MEPNEKAAGVTGLRPRTPLQSPGIADDELAMIAPMVAEHLARHGITECLVWFYTPMALPLIQRLDPLAVVYDCMDELSAFAGAPPELRQREAELMRRADLVLTGGPSLYEAKRRLHDRVLPLTELADEIARRARGIR